jgi:hypothetical protein
MEQPKGLHGREMGSFLWVVKDEGEREMEIRIVVWLGKPRSLLGPIVVCFRFGLGPVLVDSYPWLRGDLLLRIGTTMSMVRRNVLGLQQVGDGLIKYKFSLFFLYVYILLCIIIIISERCIYNVPA